MRRERSLRFTGSRTRSRSLLITYRGAKVGLLLVAAVPATWMLVCENVKLLMDINATLMAGKMLYDDGYKAHSKTVLNRI